MMGGKDVTGKWPMDTDGFSQRLEFFVISPICFGTP